MHVYDLFIYVKQMFKNTNVWENLRSLAEQQETIPDFFPHSITYLRKHFWEGGNDIVNLVG